MPMKRSEFIGRWVPITEGERLLHFLATNVASLQIGRAKLRESLGSAPRSGHFELFLEGSVVLHAFSRLMQAAKHFRTVNISKPSNADRDVRDFLVDRLGIGRANCPEHGELVRLALSAAASSSVASKSTKKFRVAIANESKGGVYCYSCGSILDPKATDEERTDYMDIEHIWPHSLGGDTQIENLLPMCRACNSTRGHLASWEWARVQAPIQGVLGLDELDDRQLGKHEKIALHTRAALDYARRNGATLKQSYRSIGPRVSVKTLDPLDSSDFFNLYAHDTDRYEVTWRGLT